MEFFFYEACFPADYSGNDAVEEAAMDWIGKHNDRSLLVLSKATLVVQGFLQNETREGAVQQAAYVASDLYWAISEGNRDDLKITVRNAAEQLAFLNAGLLPEYQLPHIPLQHVMEFGAAAHIRAGESTEARLYRTQPHPGDE